MFQLHGMDDCFRDGQKTLTCHVHSTGVSEPLAMPSLNSCSCWVSVSFILWNQLPGVFHGLMGVDLTPWNSCHRQSVAPGSSRCAPEVAPTGCAWVTPLGVSRRAFLNGRFWRRRGFLFNLVSPKDCYSSLGVLLLMDIISYWARKMKGVLIGIPQKLLECVLAKNWPGPPPLHS